MVIGFLHNNNITIKIVFYNSRIGIVDYHHRNMNRLFTNIVNKIKHLYSPQMLDAATTTLSPMSQMGRWNIDYCKTKTDIKIDLANIDHCGPCGLANKSPPRINSTKIN